MVGKKPFHFPSIYYLEAWIREEPRWDKFKDPFYLPRYRFVRNNPADWNLPLDNQSQSHAGHILLDVDEKDETEG